MIEKMRFRAFPCLEQLRYKCRALWRGPWLLAASLLIAYVCIPAARARAQRFWLAGRYDGNRIIVFLDPVKFGGNFSRVAHPLPIPATLGFPFPEELTADYVARLQIEPGARRVNLGDQYDLLMGDGRVAVVTLTTLIGYASDDEDE